MSIKSFIQTLLLLLIISIVTGVYFKYFDINKNNIVEEVNSIEIDNQEKISTLEKQVSELIIKNNELKNIIDKNSKFDQILPKDIKKKDIENKEINTKKVIVQTKFDEKEIKELEKTETIEKANIEENKDLVKDIEYNSIDDKGNNFYLLAKSGKSSVDNKNILDLVSVRGEITSNNRDTIYIVSDFGQFNSVNSNSKFYDNVIINYQEKQIICKNFEINMETNKAIAYNNVIITDQNSEMKAGIVEFDLKTKNININPESANADVKVLAN